MTESLSEVVAASSLCEVFWTGRIGPPSAAGAILLWWDDQPAFAFTFASVERAYALARATSVCVTLTEPRSTTARFTPLAIHGHARLVEDPDGTVFTEHFLTQELRRYPPSRAYADSLLLRRENWWYLPRLIVPIEIDAIRPIAERTDAGDHVIAVSTQSGNLQPLIVGLEPNATKTSATLTPLNDHEIPDGPAVAIGQDASFPDLEQWSTWTFRGRTTGDTLVLTEQPHRYGRIRVPSLWQRLTLHRRFARACRSGLNAAAHGD